MSGWLGGLAGLVVSVVLLAAIEWDARRYYHPADTKRPFNRFSPGHGWKNRAIRQGPTKRQKPE